MLVAVANRGGKQPYLIAKLPLFSGWLAWNDTFTAGQDPDTGGCSFGMRLTMPKAWAGLCKTSMTKKDRR